MRLDHGVGTVPKIIGTVFDGSAVLMVQFLKLVAVRVVRDKNLNVTAIKWPCLVKRE